MIEERGGIGEGQNPISEMSCFAKKLSKLSRKKNRR